MVLNTEHICILLCKYYYQYNIVHAHIEKQSLTIDIQSSKLVNFIVDSNIRQIRQVWI